MIEEKQRAKLSAALSTATVSRRKLMQGAAILAGGTAASSLAPLPAVAAKTVSKGQPAGAMVRTPPSTTVVETNSGKVRGYIHEDIYTFKGMPYGATTEGKN